MSTRMAVGLLLLLVFQSDAKESPAPPMLSALEIAADPPLELNEYDRRLLQNGCLQRLPEVMSDLQGDPAHVGPYDVLLQVTKIEALAEHLDPKAGQVFARRALPTMRHGLLFWTVPPLTMANPVLRIVPAPEVPALQFGAFPEDPRLPIEVFRNRGRRFVCNVEVTFEGHGTHSKVLYFDHTQAIVFPRTVQGGEDEHGHFVTRVVREPIRWSASTAPADTLLIGVPAALEVLRVQLSSYTDRVKRGLFDRYGQAKHRDRQAFERPLLHLDAAERAVVVTVGCMWVETMTRELHHRPREADLRSLSNRDVPGVMQLLSEYSATRDGAAALIAAYTSDPMALVTKLGPVLDQ